MTDFVTNLAPHLPPKPPPLVRARCSKGHEFERQPSTSHIQDDSVIRLMIVNAQEVRVVERCFRCYIDFMEKELGIVENIT